MSYLLRRNLRNIRKIKPRCLKTTTLKNNIINICCKIWVLFYGKRYKYENKGKVLAITLQALGDNILKSKIYKIAEEYYGKENFYILCRDKWASIFEKMGFNVIEYRKNKNMLKRIKDQISYMKEIKKLGTDKIIIADCNSGVGLDIQSNFRIGMSTEEKDINLDMTVTIDENSYILENHLKLIEAITNKKYSLEEVRPDIREILQEKRYNNIISIGLGASHEQKTLPISKMVEILKLLLKKYPDKDICLLGAGKKQKVYANEIEKILNNSKVKNYVDKFELLETVQMIGDSDFFIGYDSGLSNIAFALRKKYICLFWTKSKVWQHPFENVKVILGDEKNPVHDGYYGTDILNSIKVEQVEEALKELKL